MGYTVPVQMAHNQTGIVASGMHQVALGTIVHAAKCHAGHVAAAFEESEASRHQPGSETAQALSFVAAGAAAIGVEFAPGVRIAMPATTPGSIPLRDVGRDPFVMVEILDQFGLVLSLVRHGAEHPRGLVFEACKVLIGCSWAASMLDVSPQSPAWTSAANMAPEVRSIACSDL